MQTVLSLSRRASRSVFLQSASDLEEIVELTRLTSVGADRRATLDVLFPEIRDRGQQRAVEQIVDVTVHSFWGIVEAVQITSQERISERIMCASASDFERDRRVALASRLDGTSRCGTVPQSGVSTEATVTPSLSALNFGSDRRGGEADECNGRPSSQKWMRLFSFSETVVLHVEFGCVRHISHNIAGVFVEGVACDRSIDKSVRHFRDSSGAPPGRVPVVCGD